MYSNEAERANQDIYDDFKLKERIFGLHGVHTHISVAGPSLSRRLKHFIILAGEALPDHSGICQVHYPSFPGKPALISQMWRLRCESTLGLTPGLPTQLLTL